MWFNLRFYLLSDPMMYPPDIPSICFAPGQGWTQHCKLQTCPLLDPNLLPFVTESEEETVGQDEFWGSMSF